MNYLLEQEYSSDESDDEGCAWPSEVEDFETEVVEDLEVKTSESSESSEELDLEGKTPESSDSAP